MAKRETKDVAASKNKIVEDAFLAFKNFSGKPGEYNREGDRNFCIFLDEEDAKEYEEEGWNVKRLRPRDEGEPPQAYLQVSVKFDERFPINIVLVSSNGQTRLDENSVSTLDWAELEKVDLVLRPYDWEVNGKTGRKAYLKTMYATIVEDPIAQKYIDHPDSAEDSIGGCGNCGVCDGACHHEA